MLKHLASVKVDPNSVGVPVVPLNNNALADILGIVFIAVGGIAVLFLLIGAVRYVTSAGDQNNIKQAKDTILYAVIGIVISLSAFTIVQFTLGKLSGNI
jgi:hypothetical protein